ncbi:hypothetical protein B0H15DRAFT_837169 [Mycena belliarum]|uniref:Uncharacterized protein n=1 Tax=Mycena belliarum TaxID=1033014 RepID=A0AAD6XVK5_9AGAR|nr:hypothetical protein B0H15DRAFT_837169 [Mycena belliae]
MGLEPNNAYLTNRRLHPVRRSETPLSRTMLASRSTHTDGRPGAKTPGLENAIHRGGGPGISKATSKSHAAVPLHGPTTQPRITKDKTGATKSVVREVARPLLDRTPFPNRVQQANTPLPDNQKLAKLLLEANRTNALFNGSPDITIPESVRRVSTGRTHARAPRLSANNQFVTPLNNGRHWDVSDVEISAPKISEGSSVETPELEDDDEIEYMPPKVVEMYTPPFDFPLPNYSDVGKAIINLSQSYPRDDIPPAELEPNVDSAGWDMFTFSEIGSDDPFQQNTEKVVAPAKRLRAAPPARSTSRPITTSIKPQVTASNATTFAGSKISQTTQARNIRRPATAAAMYPPQSISALTSKRTPAVGRSEQKVGRGSVGEFTMLEISSPEVEDDFLFNV